MELLCDLRQGSRERRVLGTRTPESAGRQPPIVRQSSPAGPVVTQPSPSRIVEGPPLQYSMSEPASPASTYEQIASRAQPIQMRSQILSQPLSQPELAREMMRSDNVDTYSQRRSLQYVDNF